MESHLLQMRGLKPGIGSVTAKQIVASFTDAWIETAVVDGRGLCPYVASFTDAWIETLHTCLTWVIAPVASFTDAWIETATNQRRTRQEKSHLLQMRGLKPLFKGAFERVFNVASFTGTTFIIFFARRLQD